jgi:hypothetical protein
VPTLIEPYQASVYMNARKYGLTQADSAQIADISARSGQRIEAGTLHPNRGQVRDWSTRADPLAAVWTTELEPMLRREPKLQPTTLYEYLQERYPGQYPQVLRTLQRRVQTWKALYGPAPAVMFELRHEAGMMGLSDFTELKGVSITIGQQPFEHLLYHYRLAYSGWEYAQIIQGGESFVALSEGLQNALFASGGVPKQHRTDSLSAAYRNLGGKAPKRLTQLYDELCHHYCLEPTRNNKGIAHENGAIESPHGHLKNRLTQALLMRASYDFASVSDYQAFIDAVVAKLNARRGEKFKAEQQALQPLPKYRVADYEVLTARVSTRSTIEVRCILYSVPSRLIGRQLEIYLYHDRLVAYLERQPVVTLPRLRVTDKDKRRARVIDYRHVIEGLRRKPRAFLYCTWQDDLLPNEQYKVLWQQMQAQFELDSAAVVVVEALYIAAVQNKEAAVADYLETQLTTNSLTLSGLRRHFQLLREQQFPTINVQQHCLDDYDQLLNAPARSEQPIPATTESLSKSQSSSQESQAPAHARPVGNLGTSSDAATVVLRPVLARTLSIGGRPALVSPPRTRQKRRRPSRRKNGFQL